MSISWYKSVDEVDKSVEELSRSTEAFGNSSLILCGIVIAAALWIIPPNAIGLSPKGVHGLALSAMLVFWWITSAMPAGLASTLFVVLVAGLNVLPAPKLLGPAWASSTIWFVLASFGIGAAIRSTTLGERVLTYIQPMMSKGPWAVVLFFFVVSMTLSVLGMAGDFARYSMILPIFIAVASRGTEGKAAARTMALLLLTIGPATQLMVLNGIWLNPTAVLLSQHTDLSYSEWLISFAVPAGIYSLVAGYVLYFVTRKSSALIPDAFAYGRSRQLGTLSKSEKRLMFYVGIALVLWISNPWTHLNPGWSAMFVMCLICMPNSGVITFNNFLRAVNWPLVLFLSGAFALGAVMKDLGLASWCEHFLVGHIVTTDAYVLGAEVALYSIVLHLFTGDAGSAMAVAVPIFSHIATENGWSGLLYGWIAYATIFVQTFFLYQQASVLFAYGFGLFEKRDILLLGLVQAVCAIGVLGFGTVAWWQLAGGA